MTSEYGPITRTPQHRGDRPDLRDGDPQKCIALLET